jgi:hypothetical protein
MELIETVARAICIAEGVDPDKTGYGLGVTMPKGEEYPLWKARVKAAEVAISAVNQYNTRPIDKMDDPYVKEDCGPEPCDENGITFEQFIDALEHMAGTYEKYKDERKDS